MQKYKKGRYWIEGLEIELEPNEPTIHVKVKKQAQEGSKAA